MIYGSIYGNTRAVAEAIADGLRAHGDVTLEPADDQAFMDVDLLVVGAPTHAESFFVLDSEGPLKDEELERAREWGASLVGTS